MTINFNYEIRVPAIPFLNKKKHEIVLNTLIDRIWSLIQKQFYGQT